MLQRDDKIEGERELSVIPDTSCVVVAVMSQKRKLMVQTHLMYMHALFV